MAVQERLIAGLGNPGHDYFRTRHNAGFLLIDRLITRFGAREERGDRSYVLWSWSDEHTKLYLMKPTTYMNLSGHAIHDFLHRQPIAADRLLIAYDDVALPLGAIRLKPSGSSGGQKGMRHIIEIMNTQDIPRLRVGIDGPGRGALPLPDFVLSPFQDEEKPLLEAVLSQAEECVEAWLKEPVHAVMGRFNGKQITPLPKHATETDPGGES